MKEPERQTRSSAGRLTSARPDSGENVRHVGVVGDTYTILLTGHDTAGRFCLIDMHIPPVPARTTAPTKLDEAAQAAFIAKAQALAPKYRTELLQRA